MSYDNTLKVYEKNEYVILRVNGGKDVGFIVYNTRKDWEGGHTHLTSFDMARTIISNVIKKRKPKTNNIYLIRSHIRVSNDKVYRSYLEELILARKK